MTLISKATRAFLVACFIASLVGGFLCYFLLKKIMNYEATEQLMLEKVQVEKYIKQSGTIPQRWFSFSDSIWTKPTDKLIPLKLIDTTLVNPFEKEKLDYRKMTFGVKLQNSYLEVHILKALYETENLTEALLLAFTSLILLLVGMLIFVNYRLSRSLWRPFYQTLATLQTFKIAQKDALTFVETDITEFQTLQKNLYNLTEQVRRDYQSLKSFTENASHELQTPLAVINSNLELLLQDSNLTETQMQQISTLIESLGKLSKLNQTLLLLTKIENRQFDESKNIDFSATLLEKINLLEVWIQHKNLDLQTKILPSVHLQINEYLADVLLNNLLGNAIKYNRKAGKLLIELSNQQLIIKNTGNALTVSPETLFDRFSKDSSNNDSLGLGLALVKQICDTYNFNLKYYYDEGWHTIKVSFI